MSSDHAGSAAEVSLSSSKEGIVPQLSLRGIGKSFNNNVVLSGIDLDVYKGELVALLGENGAGKSHHVVDHRGALSALSWDHDLGGPAVRASSPRARPSKPV